MSGTILVVAEAGEGGLRPVSLEVVTAARKAAAAGAGDGSVTALLMGADLAGAASQLGSSGIDRMLVSDDPRLQNLPPQALAGALTCVIKRESPFAVFVASTTAGIEHAPRVAARLRLPIASDAIDVTVEDGKLIVIRPVLGGRVHTAVKLEGSGTNIVTFRSGSFDMPPAGGTSVLPEQIQVVIDEADLRVQIMGTAANEIAGKGMDTADVIVGGGRGLKEASNFALVEQLASALNGAVAATRAITDAGWRPHNEQIGQTGRVVSPRLYIAVGISGAAQHIAGLQGAEYIVAINRDPDAPIFKLASFGIVGDLFEVVPAIIAELTDECLIRSVRNRGATVDDRFDAIVVGAGPAGITAAKVLAAAGLSVVVLERGQYPGAKNVSGGILYRHPTEELCPGFESEAPLERPIIEQRYMMLTEDAMLGGMFRSMRFAEQPYNAYSVLRSEFDRWYATKAEEAGAEVYPEFTVTDLIWADGRVAGVTTGDPDGELLADVVVLADGANSLLAQRAGLLREWDPVDQALVAKELIALPAEKIEDRFALPAGFGTAFEIFGEATWGLLGYGFIYTNKESISIGTGALLHDLIDTGRNVNDMLDRFKRHPAIAPLIQGGETVEYSAHLIPEGGFKKLPQLYADGVVVVGDAAGLVNPLNREGANLAMLSGQLAAQAIIEARERGDFSAASLSRYRELLDESIVLKDLYKIRNTTDFAHARPHLFADYPQVMSNAACEYLTVDGVSKKEKQRKIAEMFRAMPKRRLLSDAIGAFRSMA